VALRRRLESRGGQGKFHRSLSGKIRLKPPDKINLGCGQRFHPDWLNVDLQPASAEVRKVDLSLALPYPDESFAVVYHSNVLEHIRPGRAEDFMRECARICRTGGILRVAVPDLEQICRLYLAKLDEAIQGKPGAREERAWMLLELVDQMTRETSGGAMGDWLKKMPPSLENFVFSRIGNEGRDFVQNQRASGPGGSARTENWWKRLRKLWLPERIHLRRQAQSIGRFRLAGEVHQWMYDRFSLGELMELAGLAEVKVMAPGESRISGWRGFGLEIDKDGSVHKPDSLIMEGVKKQD
jgi:predicted SAM-dependent methyltransferase